VLLDPEGVVGFLMPQVVSEVSRLSEARKAAEAGVEIVDGFVMPGADHPRRTVAQRSSLGGSVFHRDPGDWLKYLSC
jgi:hypothetical protein